MKKTVLIAGVVLAGILVVGWLAFGQGPAHWGHDFGAGPRGGGFAAFDRGPEMTGRLMAMLDNERVKSYLNLTDPQADRLRQILVDTEKTSVKTRADMAVRGIELRELLRSDKPDREAVMKKVQELSDLRGQIMKQHVEALLQAKTVLTPDQQKKIRAFIESRAAERGRHEGFGERRPDWGGQPPAPPHAPAPPAHPGEPPVE